MRREEAMTTGDPKAGENTLRARAAQVGAFLFDQTPLIAGVASLTFGAVALLASVTTATPPIPGLSTVEAVVDELPEFAASIAGVTLMSLAVGLRRRIDTAWAIALVLLAFFSAYALVRHEHLVGALVGAIGFIALGASRHAFYRHAGLAAMMPSRPLYLLIVAVVVAAVIGAILWASERSGFAEAPWWSLVTDARMGRAGRAVTAAVVTLGAIGAWFYLLAPARLSPAPAAPGDFSRVSKLIEVAENVRAEAQLAFLGDKSFVFSDDGDAVVMAARAGGSYVAMGAPIGRRRSWRGALARFRDVADSLALRPVVYAAPPELLPDLLDLGFRMEKVGENAVIDLPGFSLAGARRQDLRTARRRLPEREGATFEIVDGADAAAQIDGLRVVSKEWLATHKGGEKSFSLGAFDPDFVVRDRIAIVRIHEAPVAFATIWTTPHRSWAAIDLMRYDPSRAPRGTMDFLIAETLLWAQAEGYRRFDLGMAPLSGLSEERHAPLFARLGRLIYEQGAIFYNFDGLRRFKEKFQPDWEPRYLAAPGTWSMPIVLAEIAVLTSTPLRRDAS
jgi:lysylphosphatidylglycerol synthetase-like protein (DUF2156 family)